jgi:hypothetical protein
MQIFRGKGTNCPLNIKLTPIALYIWYSSNQHPADHKPVCCPPITHPPANGRKEAVNEYRLKKPVEKSEQPKPFSGTPQKALAGLKAISCLPTVPKKKSGSGEYLTRSGRSYCLELSFCAIPGLSLFRLSSKYVEDKRPRETSFGLQRQPKKHR